MSFLGSACLVLLILVALFLIVLVLIQRGKGGGLAGAFGGMGGQGAFGTKAGDLFTKVTIVTATLWIILCIVTINVLGLGGGVLSEGLGTKAENRQGPGGTPGGGAPTGGAPGAGEQQPPSGQVPPPVTPSAPTNSEGAPAGNPVKP